jgi:hypothetical protein
MKRFLNWLGSTFSRSDRRPRRRTFRTGSKPVLEVLESRVLPTVSMYRQIVGTPGAQGSYDIEVIHIDSTPTRIAVAQINGEITVTANTVIYNYLWDGLQIVQPGSGPASIDGDSVINEIQRIEIHGESGNNTYAIIATEKPVTIFSGPSDNITVGDAIWGSVAVVGNAGGTALTVSDYGDAASHTVTVDGGSITGLTPAAITYAPSQVSALTVQLGSGADTVNVAGTSVATAIVCAGDETINVGNGSVGGIGGTLSILAGGGNATINVNDQSGTGAADVRMNTGTGDASTTTITGLSPASITFDNAQTAAVNLDLPGGSSVTLDGSSDATSRTVNVDEVYGDFGSFWGVADMITGLVPATIDYTANTVANLTIDTGTGAETVNVLEEGVLYAQQLTLVGHSSQTTVNVGKDGTVQGIGGSLTVTNAVASGTTLNIDDSTDAGNRTATLDTTQAPGVPWLYGTGTGLAPASITYRTSAVRRLIVQTGTGGETFNVLAAAVPVQLTSHSSSTTANLGNQGSMARITAEVYVKGGMALTLDDSADPVSRGIRFDEVSYPGVNGTFGLILGLAPANISYDFRSLSSLYLATGTGTETVDVKALNVPNTWMVAHSNSTTDILGTGSVQSVQTSLQVRGGSMPSGGLASPQIVVEDSYDTSPRTLTVIPIMLPNVPPYSNFNFLAYGTPVMYDLLTGFAGLAIYAPVMWDTASLTIDTGLAGATVTAVGLGPTTLVGSPSAANTLNSGSGLWTFTGHNAGNIGPLSFTGFGNLNAGSGSTFAFQSGASLSGTLNAGTGNNTLDYSNFGGNVVVNLQTGQATGVGNLAGNFDTVIGAKGGGRHGVYNILVGNAGATLVGGHGRRNLLIAGPEAATLTAGDKGDILIAGDTIYDQQAGMAALEAVMAEWTRTDQSYATRVTVLTRGIVAPRLSAATVHSNGGNNVLHDSTGLNWLFVRVGADRYTRSSTEELVRL